MFGIVILGIFALYVLLVNRLGEMIFKGKFSSIVFQVALILIPLSYFQWYKFSASYKKFNELCNQTEIKVINTKPVESIFLDRPSEKEVAIALREYGYKSVQFKHKSEDGIGKKVWLSNAGDLEEESIKEFINSPSYELVRSWLVSDKLKQSITQVIDPEVGLLAEQYIYTYYQYGSNSTLLGLASGVAPSMHCPKPISRINLYEIYPAKKA